MVGHKLISWPGRMPQKQLRSLWSPSLESIIMSPRAEPAGSFPPQAGALNRDGDAARWRGGLADHDHASHAGQAIAADARRRPRCHGRRRPAGQHRGGESGGRAALRVDRRRAPRRALQSAHPGTLPAGLRPAGRERWRVTRDRAEAYPGQDLGPTTGRERVPSSNPPQPAWSQQERAVVGDGARPHRVAGRSGEPVSAEGAGRRHPGIDCGRRHHDRRGGKDHVSKPHGGAAHRLAHHRSAGAARGHRPHAHLRRDAAAHGEHSSRLLSGRLRSRDTLARLGGDEFGVLLEYCSLTKAAEIAGKLERAIEEFRYVWGERSFSLGVSIGVVAITAASGRTADVLRAADEACYAAKDGGGNRVHVAQPEAAPGLQQQVESRRIIRLSRAVDEGHFELYAQAIVPLAPEHPARPRCEILLRLPDARGGVETADAFLPQAERHRLMPAIDRWVVRQTAAVLGQWHRDHPELELPLCSINLSVSSLDDPDLVPAVREYLTQHRLPPEALCFEIAEAAALGDFAQLVRLISEIRTSGCGVGLDNFGNSLASFAHLKALSVDYVKIGGHYVRGVADDPVYGTLVHAFNY